MSVFQLTDSGDLYRPSNATSFARISGIEQCRQHMRTRLRLIQGEVFRDVRIGVQLFDLVTNPGVSETAIANHIASVALGTPGVVSCELSFESDNERGIISIDADVVYSADNLQSRQASHESLQVQFGGSIEL